MLRLLLVLAALLAALPMATAAPGCHDAPAVEHAAPRHGSHHSSPAAAPHECIGCIPPGDWLRTPVAAPFLPRAAASRPSRAADLTGLAAAPIPPPPRHG